MKPSITNEHRRGSNSGALFKQDVRRYLKEYSLPSDRYNAFKLLVFSPGLHFVFAFRATQWVSRIPVLGSFLKMLLWTTSCHFFGSEISVDAEIGGGLFVPHPYGIVIGHATIGSNVTILQNVTIGLRESSPGFATVGDDCRIGAGAKILGVITLGKGVIVGANAVVTTDVPDGAVAAGVPARITIRN